MIVLGLILLLLWLFVRHPLLLGGGALLVFLGVVLLVLHAAGWGLHAVTY
jgi:hypothetical protein